MVDCLADNTPCYVNPQRQVDYTDQDLEGIKCDLRLAIGIFHSNVVGVLPAERRH